MTGTNLNAFLTYIETTPEEFSKRIGVGKSAIYKILRGDTKKITVAMARKMNIGYKDYSTEYFLTLNNKDITISDTTDNDNSEQRLFSREDIIENKNGNTFMSLPDGSMIIQVPLVPFSAHASFLEVYEDEYQVNQAFDNTYFTVDKVGRGKYVAFTVKNDSMNGGALEDTPSGAQVLARELGRHHWKEGFRATTYGWVIICTSGIFHKDITSFNSETGEITCSSRNPSPEFQNFNLDLNEVHSIWKVIKRTF